MDKTFTEFFEKLFGGLTSEVKALVALSAAMRGNLSTSSSSLAEKQRAVKSSAGRVYDAWCANTGAADLYLGFVDKQSEPAKDGDILLSPVLIPAGFSGYLSYPAKGRPFHQGIVAVASTQVGTVALPATNVCYFDVIYE